MAETPRPIIACETHGEPKEQLPPNMSRTGAHENKHVILLDSVHQLV